MKAPMFLVWSNEHGAWWGPGSRGYTLDHRAGIDKSRGVTPEGGVRQQ